MNSRYPADIVAIQRPDLALPFREGGADRRWALGDDGSPADVAEQTFDSGSQKGCKGTGRSLACERGCAYCCSIEVKTLLIRDEPFTSDKQVPARRRPHDSPGGTLKPEAQGGRVPADRGQGAIADAHPDCRTLVCFVYDPDGRIANPSAVEDKVSQDSGEFRGVVIVAPKGS